MTRESPRRFRVGGWIVEPSRGTLTDPQQNEIHLQPKVMAVLVRLARNAGETLHRDQLIAEVWGDHAVSDEPLTRVIGELRRALHDDSRDPVYLETIPKLGYRLIAPVEYPDSAADQGPAALDAVQRAPIAGGVGSVVALGVIAVVAGLVALFEPEPPGEVVDDRMPAPPDSVAVVPFATCLDDERHRIIAGSVADEVRRELAQSASLKIAAGHERPLAVFARATSKILQTNEEGAAGLSRRLKVGRLLTGEICSRDGVTHVGMSLVDSEGFIEASDHLEFDGQLHAEPVANWIAQTAASWLGVPKPEQRLPETNRQAREHFLRARHHIEQLEPGQARAELEAALELEPDFPEALFELAFLELNGLDLDQRQGLEAALAKGEQAKRVALEHFLYDPLSFDSNLNLARILVAIAEWERNLGWRDEAGPGRDSYQARLAEAEHYLRAAVEMNPNSTSAAELLAEVLDAEGRKQEAIEILESIFGLDPYNPDLNWKLALHWAGTGRDREAIELLQRLENTPASSAWTWNWLLELQRIHGYRDEMCVTLIRLLTDYPEIAAHPQVRVAMALFVGELMWLGLRDEAEAWRARLPLDDLPKWVSVTADMFYLWGKGDQQELTRRAKKWEADLGDESILDPWHNLPMNWAWDIAKGGDLERGIELLEKVQHAPTLRDEREPTAKLLLATLYRRAGAMEDAEALLGDLATTLETAYASGVRHPDTLFQLAYVYAMQGRSETAVHALQQALQHHYRKPWWKLPLATDLAGLDKDPRVAAMRGEIETELERQAATIRTALGQYDPDELLAPLRTAR